MKKNIFIFAVSLVCVFSLKAQTLPSLLVNSDPAGWGSAGASVASPANAFAVENNAASMSLFDGTGSAAVSYGMWQPAAGNDKVAGFSGFWKASSKFSIGLLGKMFNQPSYDITSDMGVVSQVNGTFSPKEYTVGLGLAFAFTDNLSAGLTVRDVSSSLGPDAKANALSAGLSLFYSKDALRAGLSLDNLGGKVDYGEGGSSQPMAIKVGASYDALKNLSANAEADYYFSGGGFNAKIGAAYSIVDLVTLRAGYNYGASNSYVPSYASVGLGFKFAGVSLDVAFLLANENLKNSLFFGLGYSF